MIHTLRMTEADPAVAAGRLEVRVIGRATGADALDFPHHDGLHDDTPSP